MWSEDIVLVELPKDMTDMAVELGYLQETIQREIESHVVIDFSNVESITSTCLQKLLWIKKELKDCDGRKLILCCLSKKTKAIFKRTGLNNIFKFKEEKSTALLQLKTINHPRVTPRLHEES